MPGLPHVTARSVDDPLGLPTAASTAARPAPTLPRRTLLVGGSRSGKSAVAERLLAAEPVVTYVATGRPPDGSDPDWAERVRRHRARRPAAWATHETRDLAAALRRSTGPLLVDSVGSWLTGVLDACGAWDDRPGWEVGCRDHLDDLALAWTATRGPVVAVTDEVGSGVVPATPSGRLFRDLLGELNARLSLAADRVLLVVAGRVLELSHPDAMLGPAPDVRPTPVEAP